MAIYHAIVVASPNEGLVVFRKETALQFPSPLGTALFVSFEDGCFAFVNGYSQPNMDSDDFYVFLSPMDERGRKDIMIDEVNGVKCSPNWFGFTDEEYYRNEKILFKDGWNVFESDFASYPNPFHHCRP